MKFLEANVPGNRRTKIGNSFAKISQCLSLMLAKMFARISLSGLFPKKTSTIQSWHQTSQLLGKRRMSPKLFRANFVMDIHAGCPSQCMFSRI